MRDDALDVARAADGADRASSSARGRRELSSLGEFFKTNEQRLAIVSLPQAALLLPPSGADALRAGRAAKGSVDVGGRAATSTRRSRSGDQAIVLLRTSRPRLAAVLDRVRRRRGRRARCSPRSSALLLAGAVARPVRRVADASRQLAAGERPEPLPVTGSDEVKALATAFNQMAEELDRARDAERAFLLSVSHELKTPLSAIRGHGEALLDGVIEPDKVARGGGRRVGAARAARARPARPGAPQPAGRSP